MRVLKWPIPITDRFTLELPAGAKVLSVQMQGGTCCLWAQCGEEPRVSRSFAVYGTGHPMDPAQELAFAPPCRSAPSCSMFLKSSTPKKESP